MTEPLEKQLIDSFATAWGEAVPGVLGCSSTLSLISQREVMGDDVKPALNETHPFSVVFGAKCFGDMGGVVLCLFKKEDNDKIEQVVPNAAGNAIGALLSATFAATATRLQSVAPAPTTFGDATRVNLPASEPIAQLARGVGEWIWVNTFAMTISEGVSTEMMVLYAPQGSLEALVSANASAATAAMGAAAEPAGLGAYLPPAKNRAGAVSEEPSRNIERLLDVELEVVVRFGLTQIPLRELVRIGVGSMIELNRQVDEPVELLVNNRPLARGSVVVVDGYYGVCITEIGQLEERRLSLTKP